MIENVAILGASDNPERYAYKAYRMLKQYGHTPLPVNPSIKEIEGTATFESLSQIKEKIDTLTLYVNPKISTALAAEIIKAHPKRVIFNPGTENAALEKALKKKGIHTVSMCTLVLLSTQQFETA